MSIGDCLTTITGETVSVEGVHETDRRQTVYNLRVSDFHTDFVGCDDWGFSVWAQNANCAILVKEGETFILKSKVDDRVLFEGAEADARLFAKTNGHEITSQGIPGHANHVGDLPFGYKEKPFRQFVIKFDDEMRLAGYDDVEAFMQGSSASDCKYNNGNPIKLDGRAGITPSDYDVAIVSPKVAARAKELGIDVMKGPLSPKDVAALGLQDTQDALTAAHEVGHARVHNNPAAFGGPLTYPAEEVLVESAARNALAPDLSRAALRNSIRYENRWRVAAGLPPLPVPP
ncbi:hypothetical protein [Tuwongella immobilis]|uniref:Uncharacterized protein n=1 Tax=Tuwongella immobilis TaxID=692036 RepID=A0A6C2YTY6_9BACT